MILTYWGPTFKKGANQFCFDFQQGRCGVHMKLRGGRGRALKQFFIREGSAPRTNPLPLFIPFFTKEVLLSYSFY